MRYQGIIFDLDGTLINSITDLGNSVNTMLEEYNLPTFSIEEYKLKVGNGIAKLVMRSLPQDKQDLFGPALARFKEIYEAHNLDNTRPYDGIMELLGSLKAAGFKLGICTNKHEEAAKEIVKHFFGEAYFDMVVGDKKGSPRKPDPTKVWEIAKQWGMTPGEIVYLGDSDVDMQTGVNANMLPVGVLWGFRGKDELWANGAKYLLAKPMDLMKIVEE